MKTRIIITILFFVAVFSVSAQGTNDTPPAGHLDSCTGNPIMFEMFGPHCLTPVRWNQPGIIQQGYPTYQIESGIWFERDDGSIEGGIIRGYWWNFVESRYYYYVATGLQRLPSGLMAEVFDNIPPEDIRVANS